MASVADSVPAAAVPLQAVDTVVAERGAAGWLIRARKVINDHDPYLAGHFPGATVYPGVFIIESVRQAVARGTGATCHIVSVRSARFLMPLVTDDVLVLAVTAAQSRDGTLAVAATATIEHSEIPAAKLDMLLQVYGTDDAAVA